jgi:arylformamidase
MLFDISPRISASTPVFPGDQPFQARFTWSIDEGAGVNVTAIQTTPHLGAHVDAPFHTEARGDFVDALTLERFVGPAWLVAVPPVPLIEPEQLPELDFRRAPRLLLRTGSVEDRQRFPTRCSALSPRLVEHLAERGVVLVGIDTPSVDPLDSKTLDAHHALNRHGISNLEGLLLDDIPVGLYELIALPLRFAGLDASPVRAVLRTL